jgi:hypothetical protein
MTPPPSYTFAKSAQRVSHPAGHPRNLGGAYLVVLDREEDKATLGFFEKRLVLFIEIDVANKTLAGVIDILFLGND